MNHEDRILDMTREFRKAFQQEPDIHLQFRLVEEEAGEVFEATRQFKETETVEAMADWLKEMADFTYVLAGGASAIQDLGIVPELNEQLHATINVVLTLIQLAEESFLDFDIFEEAMDRIHASNMSKLDGEGNPILREDGKILKSGLYQEPDLTDLAERALDNLATKRAEEMEAA